MTKFRNIAHLYVGCRMVAEDQDSFTLLGTVKHTEGGVEYMGAYDDGDKIVSDERFFKPILTRPWELPTEVLEEVIKAKYRAITDIRISLGSHQIALFFSYRYGGTIEEKFICWDSLTASQFTILLKAGADLFNLIDSEEAIDSKTLKTEGGSK